MHRVHKVALDLNNVQATYMAKAAGTARFAYNWALAQWKEQYERSRTDPGTGGRSPARPCGGTKETWPDLRRS